MAFMLDSCASVAVLPEETALLLIARLEEEIELKKLNLKDKLYPIRNIEKYKEPGVVGCLEGPSFLGSYICDKIRKRLGGSEPSCVEIWVVPDRGHAAVIMLIRLQHRPARPGPGWQVGLRGLHAGAPIWGRGLPYAPSPPVCGSPTWGPSIWCPYIGPI